VLCVALGLALAAGGRAAAAQDPPAEPAQNESFHESSPGRVRLNDLPAGQRQRVQALWAAVICACPKENWSRTLHHCKDACADPQKEEILAAVSAGLPDERILADQKARYGPQVLAGGDVWSKALPFVFLGIGAVLVFVVLARWRRAAPARALAPHATPSEARAVERELAEIE
jgi:hypothetical protein